MSGFYEIDRRFINVYICMYIYICIYIYIYVFIYNAEASGLHERDRR
jgi:cbb3-type cytochrome oxidase subunit 3